MGISAALGSSALLPAGLGFRNLVYNGNFDIWQRGTSFSTDNSATAIYTADRWCARALYPNSTAVQTITQESTNVLAGSKYSLKSVVATATVVNNSRMQLCYTVEPADAIRYAGKQMVLSMQIKAIQNIDRATITTAYSTTGGKSFDGTTISSTNFTVNTSGFTTCTVYFTLPAAATLTTSGTIGFYITYTRSSGSAEVVGDGIYLSQVQLEQNYQPTPFEQRPYGVELQLCQRYYYRYSNATLNGGGLGYISGFSSTRGFGYVHIPTEMRGSITITPTSCQYDTLSLSNAGNITALSTYPTVANAANTTTLMVDCTLSAGATVGTLYHFRVASGGAIQFSAEL